MTEQFDLQHFIGKFEEITSLKPKQSELIKQGQQLLTDLVSSRGLLNDTLSRLALDNKFLQSQWLSIDSNEIILYRSPQKNFSIRAYIWEPGLKYPVHDHGAWGIVGAHINPIRERKFDLVAADADKHYAEVKLVADKVLNPGQITVVLPLDGGIHQMEAVDRTAVTVHVYGPPVRKGYIKAYDLHFKQVTRIYPPYLQKKVLAIRTMGSISDSWAEGILNEVLQTDNADYIRLECTDALNTRKGFPGKD